MELKVSRIIYDDLKLTSRYSEKIRGYLGNKYKAFDLLHNHNGNKFIYRYPLVQYKVIDKKPMIIGINEASSLVSKIALQDDSFILNDKEYSTFQKKILNDIEEFSVTDDYVRYKLITPWIALNQNNIEKYYNSNVMEQEKMLNKILIGNILSVSKNFKYNIEKKMVCWLNLKEKDVMFKGIKHKAFIGEFKINFMMPDYFGIGKAVSRGFGTIIKE